MKSLIDSWWCAPLAMCLVVTAIHGYLGIHVLKRKVIFVDLAMAQLAALGAAYGILLGYDPKDPGSVLPLYLFSLTFTLVGAAVISLARMRNERVPQEAFIGIVYASASALAMLLLAKTPTEGEQIKHMLVGRLLTVRWDTVGIAAAVYAVIGAFHYACRRKFFQISDDHESAEQSGLRIGLWDFLFYVSFGVVITISATIAGVLLVFSYLVVPGVIAVMYAESDRARIVMAWVIGVAVSVAGLVLSDQGGFPTGPSIVAAFTVALVVASVAYYVRTHAHWGVALGRLAGAAALFAAAIWGTTFLRAPDEHHHHESGDPHEQLVEALSSENETAVLDALSHIAEMKDKHSVRPVMDLLASTKSDGVIQRAAETLAALDAKEAMPLLKEIAKRDLDDDLKVHLAEAMIALRDATGLEVLIDVMEKGEARVAREDARRLFERHTGRKAEDVPAVRQWWSQRGGSLKWREETNRFE